MKVKAEQAKVLNLKAQQHSLQQDINRKAEELTKQQAELDTIEKRRNDLTAEISECLVTAAITKQELEEAREILAVRLKSFETKKLQFEAEKAQQEILLNQREHRIEARESAIDAVIDSKQDKVKSLNKQIRELENKCQEFETQYTVLIKSLTNTEENIESVQGKADQIKREAEDFVQSQMKVLEKETKADISRKAQLERLMVNLDAKEADLIRREDTLSVWHDRVERIIREHLPRAEGETKRHLKRGLNKIN